MRKITLLQLLHERASEIEAFNEISSKVKKESLLVGTAIRFNKNSTMARKANQILKTLPVYNLIKYFRYENFIIRRMDYENNFAEIVYKDLDLKKLVDQNQKRMNRCIMNYLKASNNCDIVAYYLSPNFVAVELPEYGKFMVSTRVASVFNLPIIKNKTSIAYFSTLMNFLEIK